MGEGVGGEGWGGGKMGGNWNENENYCCEHTTWKPLKMMFLVRF